MEIAKGKKNIAFQLVVSEESFKGNSFALEDFLAKRNRVQDVDKVIDECIKAYNEVYMEGTTSTVKMSAENVGLANKGYLCFTIEGLCLDSDFYFQDRVSFLRYLGYLFVALGLKSNLNAMQGALVFKDVIIYFDGLYKDMEVSFVLTASVCNTCNFEFGKRFHCLSLKEEVIDAEKRDTVNNGFSD